MPKQQPHETDKQVGARVRQRRVLVGMSQDKLGTALGISFQQIQKYEKGANRIGASRLQQISDALGVPVAYFFEGLASEADAFKDAGIVDPASLDLKFAANFARLRPEQQRSVRTIVDQLLATDQKQAA